jgi:hypothetical protein
MMSFCEDAPNLRTGSDMQQSCLLVIKGGYEPQAWQSKTTVLNQ